MTKKRFYGSWPWGLLITVLIFVPVMIIPAVLGENGNLGSVLANAGKIVATLAAFFWVFFFPRARKSYRQSEQAVMNAEAREKEKDRPLAVRSDLFEALCPRCGLRRAIFADDPELVSCTCGARLAVRRSGEGGTLELSSGSEAQNSSSEPSANNWRSIQVSSSLLANRSVTTLDGELKVYKSCDPKSATVGSPLRGTEIRLGSVEIVDGREWVEATLPNGDRGYALGPSLRSHSNST